MQQLGFLFFLIRRCNTQLTGKDNDEPIQTKGGSEMAPAEDKLRTEETILHSLQCDQNK